MSDKPPNPHGPRLVRQAHHRQAQDSGLGGPLRGLRFALKPSEISKKFRGPSPGNLSDFSGQDSARLRFAKQRENVIRAILKRANPLRTPTTKKPPKSRISAALRETGSRLTTCRDLRCATADNTVDISNLQRIRR